MQESTQPSAVEYPEEGEKLGQGVLHFLLINELFAAASRLFRERDGFVAADLFFYYEEGNRQMVVAPDLLIKRNYRKSRFPWCLWIDGLPDLVGEVCSDTTGMADVTWKLELYQRLGIRYYFVFDPERRYVMEGLRAWEWKEGRYERLAVLGSSVYFPEMEMGVRMSGKRLRVVDERGRAVRTLEEEVQRSKLAEVKAREEAKRAREEAKARKGAEARAEAEAKMREEAERELMLLRAKLQAMEGEA